MFEEALDEFTVVANSLARALLLEGKRCAERGAPDEKSCPQAGEVVERHLRPLRF